MARGGYVSYLSGAMQTRRLGASSLELPRVAFGAWAIGGWWWGPSDDEEACQAMHAWLDGGGRAIDTAPVYGFGHSERLIARVLSERRDRALILTKAGLVWDQDQGVPAFETKDQSGKTRRVLRNSRPNSLRREVDQSLARLGIERIDLLQIHWRDETTPIADSMGALLELKREGKLAWIGVSNFRPTDLQEARRALGTEPLVSTQERLSLMDRRVEGGALAFAREHSLGFLAYSPLEQGLLTGKLTPERQLPPGDLRTQHAKFSPRARQRVLDVLHACALPIAQRHKATFAQIALAWVFQTPGVTCALAGARNAAQARENLAAANILLSPDEYAALERGFLVLCPNPGSLGTLGKLARSLLGRS